MCVAPVVSEIFALQVKNTLSYDSAEVTMETKSCIKTLIELFCELKIIAPEGDVLGIDNVKSALFSDAVERYPAVPRPCIEEVREVVEMYPTFPRPCVVETRLPENTEEERYPKVPRPCVVDMRAVVEIYPAVPSPCVVEVSDDANDAVER